jgi:hypothetical protein
MSSRCDICIDPECKGKRSCHCKICDKQDYCHRFLAPTIRITTKCTQSCSHCCFSCSPKKTDFMFLQMAENINKFLINNSINYINVMGGEFFMHPDWFDIISTLCNGVEIIRLVTNGDWVKSAERSRMKTLTERFLVIVALSKDRWHTNENVDAAKEFCSNNKIPYKVATEDQVTAESVVPVGNAQFEMNIYSMFMKYCGKPDRKYNFLIDEQGNIFKCSFGAWQYANVSEYLDGGFAKRFRAFNEVFYSSFVSSCKTCLRSWHRVQREERNAMQGETI